MSLCPAYFCNWVVLGFNVASFWQGPLSSLSIFSWIFLARRSLGLFSSTFTIINSSSFTSFFSSFFYSFFSSSFSFSFSFSFFFSSSSFSFPLFFFFSSYSSSSLSLSSSASLARALASILFLLACVVVPGPVGFPLLLYPSHLVLFAVPFGQGYISLAWGFKLITFINLFWQQDWSKVEKGFLDKKRRFEVKNSSRKTTSLLPKTWATKQTWAYSATNKIHAKFIYL